MAARKMKRARKAPAAPTMTGITIALPEAVVAVLRDRSKTIGAFVSEAQTLLSQLDEIQASADALLRTLGTDFDTVKRRLTKR